MKLKIKNKRKFIRSIIVVIILAIALLFMGISQTYSNAEIRYKEEYIINGDTLWTISSRELKTNKYYKNKDVRYIIQEIKNINNLESSEILEGQKLLIPTI